MLQIFQSHNGVLKESQVEFSGGINLKNCWVHLTNPTDKESELIVRTTGIPEDMLKAALDEEERARIEYDDGCTLVLFDIPVIEEESSYFTYSTMPLAAILTPDCFVTVCLKGKLHHPPIHKRAHKKSSTPQSARGFFICCFIRRTPSFCNTLSK